MKLNKFLIIAIILIPITVLGQAAPNVVPGDSFAWNETALTLAEAQGYVYKYYLDGAVTGSVFSGVTCSGTASPFTCQALTPQFANGTHSITLTAASASGESPQSTPFGFVFGNPPSNPNNIRVIKGAVKTELKK